MFDHAMGVGEDAGGAGDCEVVSILTHHSGDVKALSSLPSEPDDVLLSASYDASVNVYTADEAGDYSLTTSLKSASAASGDKAATIWSLAVTPHGTRLYAGTGEGEVLIYHIEDGEFTHVHTLTVAEEGTKARPIYSIAVPPPSASHGCVLLGYSSGIYLYREVSSVMGGGWTLDCRAKQAHEQDVMSVAFVDDGRALLSVGEEGKIRFWSFVIG
jgi:WD40 repeat protein